MDDPAVQPKPIPEVLRRIERIDTIGVPEMHLDLTIANSSQGSVTMGINGVDGRSIMHGAEPIVTAKVGDTQIWRVTNDTDFAHPFHLHGYFFQVLDANRVPEWKDTVDVPAKSEIRIAVRFEDRPGMWMVHCHILDHAELGMMGLLRVVR